MACLVRGKHIPQLLHFGMVKCVGHSVAPFQLATLEEPLASVLSGCSRFESLARFRKSIPGAAENHAQDALLHVIALGNSSCESRNHAQFRVDFSRRIGVNLEGAFCAFLVVWNADGVAAADQCEGGGGFGEF